MNRIVLLITMVIFFVLNSQSQKKDSEEKYGKTLNVGIGIGYYGNIGKSMPVVHFDYEIDVVKNLTLSPSISFYTYQKYNYWGSSQYAYKDYSYRQIVVPIGLKGTYYFDELLKARVKWDFYLAASLGFKIRKTTWDSEYHGNTTTTTDEISPLYLDFHIGSEYHLNDKTGLFLDLSTGVSTFGLAVHL